MISGPAFVFVLLPCISATLVAMVVFDLRVGIVALLAALCLFGASDLMPVSVRLISLPIIIGSAIGLVALNGRLLLTRMDRAAAPDLWSRMLWALIPTFTLTFLFLTLVFSGA